MIIIDTELGLCLQGEPVNFTDSVAYVCAGDDLYYEEDRDMTEYNVTCLPGGGWAEPELWPRCVHCEQIAIFLSQNTRISIKLSTAHIRRTDLPQARGSGMETLNIYQR